MPPSDAGLLTAVLKAVARRGCLVPNDWTNVLTLVSLRSPDQFDRDAFERLRRLFKADYGFELTVVGGAYGCFKLFVHVEYSPDGNVTGVGVDSNTQLEPEVLSVLVREVMNSAPLRRGLAEAGIAKVQTRDVTYDVRTDERGLGHGSDRPIIIATGPIINVSGPVASIGNENTISGTDVSAGQEQLPATCPSPALEYDRVLKVPVASIGNENSISGTDVSAGQEQLPAICPSPALEYDRVLKANWSEIVKKITEVKGAVVSMGDHNRIRDVNVHVSIVEAMSGGDLRKLTEQLCSVRGALQPKAVSADDFVELGHLAQAEKAAQAGDRPGVFDALKKVGRWGLDAARDLGLDLLAEVIKKSAGIG